jgi:hypothetical protein
MPTEPEGTVDLNFIFKKYSFLSCVGESTDANWIITRTLRPSPLCLVYQLFSRECPFKALKDAENHVTFYEEQFCHNKMLRQMKRKFMQKILVI